MYEIGIVGLTMPFRGIGTEVRQKGLYGIESLVLDEASLVHFSG